MIVAVSTICRFVAMANSLPRNRAQQHWPRGYAALTAAGVPKDRRQEQPLAIREQLTYDQFLVSCRHAGINILAASLTKYHVTLFREGHGR